MVVRYKLTYFDMRGLGEPIRLLLVDNNIPFEEKRYTKEENEDWQRNKTKYAFHQLPCLQDDDECIVQTGAIMRHLARKHGLYGRTECDHTFADMFYEGIKDLHSKYAQTVYCGEDEDFEKLKKRFLTETLPAALGMLEKLIKTFEHGEHFILGERISFVDYFLFEELDSLLSLDHTCLENFPVLTAYHSRMNQRSSLQNHLMRRAATKVPINWSGHAN